jgi:phosphate starvation-inducible protein PhoH and related proteins
MSKRKDKNPNGKIEHQQRLEQSLHEKPERVETAFSPLPEHAVEGISSPKLINRPKFRANIPKMRSLVYRPRQQQFIDTIQNPDAKIVVLTGPAGSGKTLLAVRKGLEGVLNGRFADLVLCRPLVEAGGEQMGYLPGGVDDKIGPYLEPFYDKLTAFLPDPTLKSLLNEKHIAAAPLAFMRGRTFSESFVIIDEAQNTSVEQMKMAVTRLGPFSKMVICGDPDQSDIRGMNGLESDIRGMNGLEYISKLFEKEGAAAAGNGCHVCRLGMEDIQRNSVIAYLLKAFTDFKSSLPQKVERSGSHADETRLATLLERTLNQVIANTAKEEKELRPTSRIRNGRRPARPLLFQTDLFGAPAQVVLPN